VLLTSSFTKLAGGAHATSAPKMVRWIVRIVCSNGSSSFLGGSGGAEDAEEVDDIAPVAREGGAVGAALVKAPHKLENNPPPPPAADPNPGGGCRDVGSPPAGLSAGRSEASVKTRAATEAVMVTAIFNGKQKQSVLV
jgi:hypothetical protein